MQCPRTDIGSPSLWWGKEKQIEFVNVPLMIGIGVSHNSWIPASEGNPVSCVWAGGNGNMFSALVG